MSSYYGEAVCRAALQEFFPDETFVRTRSPEWLRPLELDCYCPAIRLAVEFHGKQHYEYVPFFHHNDPANFEAQKERDQRKREATHGAWVTLLEVPHTIPVDQIRGHLRRELESLGYSLAPSGTTDAEFLATVRSNTIPHPIDETSREQAEACGYTLLASSDVLVGQGSKARLRIQYKVRCARGHEYLVLRENFMPVVDGHPKRGCIWCARQRENGKRGEAARAERARHFGLECQDAYAPRHTAARWRCLAAGHEFVASWNTVNLRKTKKCLLC